MPALTICPQCDSAIPENASEGLCPRCLMSSGVELLPGFQFTDVPQSTQIAPPAHKQFNRSGDYELLEEIARGGMGIVYRARQISLNRIVAVKALLFAEFASDDFIRRFQTEAQAAARLQHPNIVGIHEVWEHAGQPFFSMEYVPGHTLAEALRDGPLPARRAARYVEILARALQYAHSQGVLHRDLKPSNILIDHADQPRITDFGIAKQLDAEKTRTSTSRILGSPQYMSPEQANPKRGEISARSDIYSLGALLYQTITGRPPSIGESIEEILQQTFHVEPTPPRLLNSGIARDLETICLKCLQKDPARRYNSAQELADDLRRFLEHRPIQARPVSALEKSARWTRRNPAASVTLGLLALIAISSTWLAFYLQQVNSTARIQAYVSDMNIAFRHMDEGNTAHVLEILKSHVPRADEIDLRGFEWRHLWARCRGNYQQWLPTHPKVVGAIQFGNPGDRVVTFAWNRTVRVWQSMDRSQLSIHENVAAFGGLTADEKNLVLSRDNGTLQLIDAITGATNKIFPNAGTLLAYAKNSDTAVTLNSENKLVVLNLFGDAPPLILDATISRDKTEFGLNSPVAISANGQKLALIVQDSNPFMPARGIRVWDLTTGREIPGLRETREYRTIAFSPDGSSLAAGDGEGDLRLLNLASNEHQTIQAHTKPILSLAFSPDGATVATGSSDAQCIRVWDIATAQPKQIEITGQVGDVWSLAFSPDGQRLASGSRDGPIRIWNLKLATAKQLDRLHADNFGNVAFSHDGKLFAGGCLNNTTKIWNVATLDEIAVIPRAAYVVAFSADDKRILLSDPDGDPFWFDLAQKTRQPLPRYSGNLKDMVSVDLSTDGQTAAIGLLGGKIQLIDIATGAPTGPDFTGHQGPVRSIAFSPNGDILASGGADRNVKLWDRKTGASLGACTEHIGSVFGVTISPSGKTLASGCGAESIKLWHTHEISKGSWASMSYHKSVIRSLSFSPDERTLASGSDDHTVKLWNLTAFSKRTPRREIASFSFAHPLRLVRFSPDGNSLAAVTDKGEVRLLRAVSLNEADRALREMR